METLSGAVGGCQGYTPLFAKGSSAVGRGEIVGGAICGEALSRQHSMTDSTPPRGVARATPPPPRRGRRALRPRGAQQNRKAEPTEGGHIAKNTQGGSEREQRGADRAAAVSADPAPRPRARDRTQRTDPRVFLCPRARRAGGKGPKGSTV